MKHKNKLLLVVDMQNDFSEKGRFPVKGAIDLANRIDSFLINVSDAQNIHVAYSMDWHPNNHCSFHQFPKHCIRNTWGAKLIKPLHPKLGQLVIKKAKKKDSEELSAFSPSTKQKLEKYINKHHIEQIYVMGLVKEYCVLKTCIDALNLGLETFLIKDLTLALNEASFIKNKPTTLKVIGSHQFNKI